ncbi:hypothetical protein [Paracoccus sp. MC1862]|uniref:hypothetical protein n=1 Tax=Paracoccus sp. MC1862 TaxID=2760307 RepID=UPI00190A5F7A|nr:hypothetical protein [Paracoccus sp. MC1862]QQO46777.1 hypothetical protein JGR78_17525 [Paracoccus sp. MC1862]
MRRHEPGATLIEVIDGYARRVEAAGSLLLLSELGGNAVAQLRRTRKIGVRDKVGIFPATENLGDPTRQAVTEAIARPGRAETGDDR